MDQADLYNAISGALLDANRLTLTAFRGFYVDVPIMVNPKGVSAVTVAIDITDISVIDGATAVHLIGDPEPLIVRGAVVDVSRALGGRSDDG